MTTLRNTGDASDTPVRTRRIARVGQALGTAALAGGLAGLTACADAPTAGPAAASSGPRLAATTTVGDTTFTSFRVEPGDNEKIVFPGTHKLVIPRGAICDPATSGYGPTLWDAPCTPAAAAIDFVAKTWTDAGGHPRIEITPDVRFVPGTVVTMYLKDKQASLDATSNIAWCPTGGAACVDESAADASLQPTRDGANGWISRRVKHFSGYNVVFGFRLEIGLQLNRAARASGYITTSGLDGGDARPQGKAPQ
jgi:hypothetical protein